MQTGTYRVTGRHPRTGIAFHEEEIEVVHGTGATEESLLLTSKMAAQLEGKMGATLAATSQWSIVRVA